MQNTEAKTLYKDCHSSQETEVYSRNFTEVVGKTVQITHKYCNTCTSRDSLGTCTYWQQDDANGVVSLAFLTTLTAGNSMSLGMVRHCGHRTS